jgi:hypothetical protein
VIEVTIIDEVYALSTHREYTTADSIMGSIVNPCFVVCLPSMSASRTVAIRGDSARRMGSRTSKPH